jgi:hypothetical protein
MIKDITAAPKVPMATDAEVFFLATMPLFDFMDGAMVLPPTLFIFVGAMVPPTAFPMVGAIVAIFPFGPKVGQEDSLS